MEGRKEDDAAFCEVLNCKGEVALMLTFAPTILFACRMSHE